MHFDEFNDVADHCTICHKCSNPCPFDIDFGDVSIRMRNFLREQDKKKFVPAKAAAMAFLTMKDAARSALTRQLTLWGYAGQRLAHKIAKSLGLIQRQTKQPPATLGQPSMRA